MSSSDRLNTKYVVEQPLIILPGALSSAKDWEVTRGFVVLEMSDWEMGRSCKNNRTVYHSDNHYKQIGTFFPETAAAFTGLTTSVLFIWR